VLVKRSPFTRAEIETLQARFAGRLVGVYFPLYHRLFGRPAESVFAANEILYAPGAGSSGGPHADLLAALAEGRGTAWMAAQTRDVRPTTDDRPFFFVLDKWGYYAPNFKALGLTLALLSAATLVFLVVPPFILNRRGLALPGALPLAAYFLALGLGYIAVEVNLIQKLSLFLGHPAYALATTLCGLLIASGLGSLASGLWPLTANRKIGLAAGGTAMFALLGAVGLAPLFDALISLPLGARLSIAIVLTALPGFLMGFPFPSGLAALRQRAPAFVPWAWALNGSGTVIGTIVALLAAMQYGFSVVFVAAAGLYVFAGIAFAVFWRQHSAAGQSAH
jgi:hypothetical protein